MNVKNCVLFAALSIFISSFFSCKKASNSTPAAPVDSSQEAVIARDSALIDARDFYIWYNQIPSTFNAQSYTTPADEMVAIRAYSNEPGYSSPVDKWSYGILKSDWNQLSAGIGYVDNIATSGDFGMSVLFRVDGDLRVRQVERLSPAGIAGVQRGWRITKINGSTDITENNSDYIVNAIFYSGSSTFTFIKPDGTSVDMTLTANTYTQQPVYLDTTYQIGSKKIGYLVVTTFLGDTTQMNNAFGAAMNNFATKNVTDIIVDLRYNGGGYVSAQASLADYLAPSSANGSLMMKETFNDKHQDYNTSYYFNKMGPLNPNHILFIVTDFTLSASELIINNLMPKMTVKLVGPDNTGGKPVGFFPLSAGDWYVFPVSFRSFNSAGYGGYFNGFAPDGIAEDGLDKNWGDTTETCLAKSIEYITTGSFARTANESTYKAGCIGKSCESKF